MHSKLLEKSWKHLKSEAPFWKKESTDKGFRWVEPQAEISEDMNEA